MAAHETSILQFMSDFGIEYRILDEPLQVVGLGVAFALNDDRGLDTALNAALADMRTDGTTRAILAKVPARPGQISGGGLWPLNVCPVSMGSGCCPC